MAREKQMERRDPFRDIEQWDPFSYFPLRSLRMPRWMEDIAGDVGLARGPSPALDVCETDEAYEISVEVPGVKKDDISIECKEGILSIRGEKRSERDEKRASARLLERSYGAFTRSLALPTDADPEKIEASYRDGVLTVGIKKRPEAKSKTIAIKDR